LSRKTGGQHQEVWLCYRLWWRHKLRFWRSTLFRFIMKFTDSSETVCRSLFSSNEGKRNWQMNCYVIRWLSLTAPLVSVYWAARRWICACQFSLMLGVSQCSLLRLQIHWILQEATRIKIHFNIILKPLSRIRNWPHSFRFPYQHSVYIALWLRR
jgi:hypothetical protein